MTNRDVSAGPFDRKPVELGVVLSDGFDPTVSGEEIERRVAAWLVSVLSAQGVVLGEAVSPWASHSPNSRFAAAGSAASASAGESRAPDNAPCCRKGDISDISAKRAREVTL